jgi:hypothetical protein
MGRRRRIPTFAGSGFRADSVDLSSRKAVGLAEDLVQTVEHPGKFLF